MSPRPRLTDEETSEHARRIVEATFAVIAETGDAAPPIRTILREAGLGRQQFYRCFETKADLMTTVIAEGRAILVDYLATRMAAARRPEDKVRAWVRGIMRQAQTATERTRPFIVASPVRDNAARMLEPERALSSVLADAIAQGAADGAWDSPDPDADALVIYDFTFSAMQRHLLRDERPTRETIRRLGDFAVGGLVGTSDLGVPSRR